MAAVPPRFWKRVTLAHANRWTVVLWPAVLLGTLGLASGIVRMTYTLARGTPPPVWMTPAPGGGWTAQTMGPLQAFWYEAQKAWGMPWYPVTVSRWSPERALTAMLEMWAAPLAVLAASLVTGATLLTLTSSRRACGVKPGHIVRAMTYRLAPLGFLYLLWCAWRLVVFLPVSVRRSTSDTLWVLVLVGLAAWGVWWWRTTLVRGWLMPRAGMLWLLLGTVDVLASLAAYLLLSPYTAARMMV